MIPGSQNISFIMLTLMFLVWLRVCVIELKLIQLCNTVGFKLAWYLFLVNWDDAKSMQYL